MNEFTCATKDVDGKDVRIIIEADSVRGAVAQLRKQGLTAISVTPMARKKTAAVAAKRPGRYRRIKLAEVAIFCRQLSVMLEAGLPMVDSVKDVGDQCENLRLRDVLLDVAKKMEAGEMFSAAIGKHSKVFGQLFVSMARAGEEGGSLAKVLGDLATYLESQVTLRRKVKAATTYPAFIAAFFVMAVSGVVFFLIPKFENIFKSYSSELPALTKVIMGVSRAMLTNVHFIIVGVLLLIVALMMARRTDKGRHAIDAFKLRIPIFGKLFHKVALTRFTAALATLMENGVSMISSLEIVSSIAGNVVVGDAIERSRVGIIKGSSLTAEMRKEGGLFPPILIQMLSAGEQSGRMSTMLKRYTRFIEEEVSTAVESLTAVIEPVLIVLLGGVVAIVVLAIYLPIFKMTGQMH